MSSEPIIPDPELLAEIIAFCEEREISETRFGMKTVGDKSLIANMKKGRELRRKTRQRVCEFMRDTPAMAAADTPPG